MHVGRETSAQCECVGAGLFLSNTPLLCLARLSVQIRANEFRPLDTRFHFDQTVFLIKRNHAIEGPRVDANAIRGKLLATHRMTAARNGDGKAFSRRGALNLSQANYFASGERFIGYTGYHLAQIIVIEKSDNSPWAYQFNKVTSCSPPNE